MESIELGFRFPGATLTATSNTFKQYISGEKVILIRCVCDCGQEKLYRYRYLINGDIKDCGCVTTSPYFIYQQTGAYAPVLSSENSCDSLYVMGIKDYPHKIKIGIAKDAKARVKTMQGANFDTVILLKVFEGKGYLEKAVLAAYEERQRRQGYGKEWFDFSGIDDPVAHISKTVDNLLSV